MATVVNSPDSGSNSMGMVFAVILLLVIAVLFFIYGLPMLSGNTGTNVTLPGTVNVQTK